MSFLGTLLIALAKVISLILNLYTFIIAGSVIISWVQPDPYNPIVRFLRSATDPVFSYVRRFVPRFLLRSGVDITPLLVIIVIVFAEALITSTLIDTGLRLRSPVP